MPHCENDAERKDTCVLDQVLSPTKVKTPESSVATDSCCVCGVLLCAIKPTHSAADGLLQVVTTGT